MARDRTEDAQTPIAWTTRQTLKDSSTGPVEAAKATPVVEADTPPLRIIPPIVNSQLGPPGWAGDLHVSSVLYRGRSASAGWQGRMKP